MFDIFTVKTCILYCLDLKYISDFITFKDTKLKYLFGLLFISSALILFFTIRKCKKIKNPMVNSMRYLFYSAILSTISNIVVLFSQNYLISYIFYSIFFIGIDGLVFFLFCFTVYYVNLKINSKLVTRIAFSLFAIDSLNIILNIFFQHAFGLTQIQFSGATYIMATHLLPYKLHLILTYSTIALVFCILLYKSIVSPKMYKIKYLSILISFLLVTVADAFYIFLFIPIDFSVILFSLTGILYYYITFHFTPHKLIERALSLVVENLDYAIIFFDNTGKCIYKNKSFEDIYLKYNNLGIFPKTTGFDSWYENDFFKDEINLNATDQEINKAFKINGNIHKLNAKFHNIKDEHNKIIGNFFLIQDKTQDEQILQYERYLTNHDTLTGLYNKYYFFDRAQNYLQKNNSGEYLLVSIKLANHGFLTEVFGKYMIDNFIIKLSKEISSKFESKSVYGRIGEDNFAILIQKEKFDIDDFNNYSKELSTISEDKFFPTRILTGIYEVEDIQTPISVMCDRANIAISELKNNPKEKIGYYTVEIKNRNKFEQSIISDFPKALSQNQFKIFIQPQFSKEKKLIGGEILVRWFHPTEGLLQPEQFLYLYETNSIITQLDMYIWEETAKILNRWNESGKKTIPISVNISPKDICYLDICTFFTDLTKKYNIKPKQLKLEITEPALTVDNEYQVSLISKLRKAGFIVQLDDFGNGYSSLNTLIDYSFDELKLDLSCFNHISNNEQTQKIISTILDLSQKLKLPLIAEGVETEEQFNFLKKAGCKNFQGYFLEKPIDIMHFERKYFN